MGKISYDLAETLAASEAYATLACFTDRLADRVEDERAAATLAALAAQLETRAAVSLVAEEDAPRHLRQVPAPPAGSRQPEPRSAQAPPQPHG